MRQPPPNQGTEDSPSRRLLDPLREFVTTEVTGGVVLLVAAVVAIAWANSPAGDSYSSFWNTRHPLTILGFDFPGSLQEWVNEGLMTLFFFVVGLEIKREFTTGELAGGRKAALPVIGALGGMAVPGLLYLAVNVGGAGSRGWGIPMATDIAFALGALALMGGRVRPSTRIFLLSLAIVDDIGAMLIIAFFYAGGLSPVPLMVAAALLGSLSLLHRTDVSWAPIYLLLTIALWVTTLQSGVHATIAGVALALVTPVRATQRIEHVLHPWVSGLVLPLFALANAGVVLSGLGAALTSRVAVGILLGCVVGKIVGISVTTWLAVRTGLGVLPEDMDARQVLAVAAVSGIGFTVALFVTGLAFEDPALLEASKVGILAAALVAAAVTGLVLHLPGFGGRSRAR